MACSISSNFDSIGYLSTQLEIKGEEILDKAKVFATKHFSSLGLQHPFCVFTTGSDGRNEKSDSCSPTELVFVVSKEEVLENEGNSLSEAVRQILRKEDDEGLFFQRVIEVKTFNDPLLYGKDIIIPTRATEAVFLYGDLSTFQEFRHSAYRAIQTISADDEKYFRIRFAKNSAQVIRRCHNKLKTSPVDIDQGILFFDNQTVATKHVFLRPVQYKVMTILIQAIKSGKLLFEDFEKLPKSIPQRLEWMHNHGLLPSVSKEELIDIRTAYLEGLGWHLLSQNQYGEKGRAFEDSEELIKIYVDSAEIQQLVNSVLSFIEK